MTPQQIKEQAAEVEYGHCNECGYENTSTSDCCYKCGSLDKSFYKCTVEEWENEH